MPGVYSSFWGMAVAAMAAEHEPYYRKGPRKPKHPSPNDVGPVIDSTKESKRARRRRLARAALSDEVTR